MTSTPFDIALRLGGFLGAFASSLALTYLVRDRARRAGLFDPLDERKLHTQPIPRIGGVGIFAAVALTSAVLVAVAHAGLLRVDGGQLARVLAGACAIFGLGLWDDLRPMRPRWKFVAQILIALAISLAGVRMTTMSLPFVGLVQLSEPLAVLVTVLWFVGITNAFNLIDGLDGLAAGAALFALTTMFVVASLNGQVDAAVITIILAGATLGFLFFNFPPASIFLGDSGSLFLGFMLAGIGLVSSQKSPTVVAVAIPVVSLGLPVVDTALAIVRRFLRGQPIFSADRGHIHHRLLSFGHSPRKAALLLYGVCALLALSGMLMLNAGEYVALLLVVLGLGVGLAVQRLRIYEFEELARLLRKGVRQRAVIGRGVRIREASVQLSHLADLDGMFALLANTFAEDQFKRAEMRLRPSFIRGAADRDGLDRRLDDDVPVWTWVRDAAGEPAWWEIKLPLLRAGRERIGSLVLWQDGTSGDNCLSHLHTIAEDLRGEVERKMVALWPSTGTAVLSKLTPEAVARLAALSVADSARPSVAEPPPLPRGRDRAPSANGAHHSAA